jgi:hypothetical protein
VRRDRPPGPLAPRAVAGRTYELAVRCPADPARVVVDRFTEAADRDAAAQRFESPAPRRDSGAIYTLGATTDFVQGSGDDTVQDRLNDTLRAAGTRCGRLPRARDLRPRPTVPRAIVLRSA